MSSKNKGKGKAKKDKKEPPLSRVEATFYELEIADLEKKIQRLRNGQEELRHANGPLAEQIRALKEDRKDPAGDLSFELEKVEKHLGSVNEDLKELQQVYDDEKRRGDETIADLEAKFRAMHDQLTSEIKTYNSKIYALNEFRENADNYFARLNAQDREMKAKQQEYEDSLKEIKADSFKKDQILRKDIETKLLAVAENFMQSFEIRSASYTRRIIRENIALQKEIDSLANSARRIQQQLKEEEARHKEITIKFPALQKQKRDLITQAQRQQNSIEKATFKYEKMHEKYLSGLVYRDKYKQLTQELDCEHSKRKKFAEEARRLIAEVDKLKLERSELLPMYYRNAEILACLKHRTGLIKTVIARAISVVSRSEPEPLHASKSVLNVDEDDQRDLLSKLTEILAADVFGDSEIDTPSSVSRCSSLLYASEFKKKSSDTLFEIFRREGHATPNSGYSDISIALDHYDKTSMIYPAERDPKDAGQIFDVVSGTTLYVSSIRQGIEHGMMIDEREELHTDTETSSSRSGSSITQISGGGSQSAMTKMPSTRFEAEEISPETNIIDVEMMPDEDGDHDDQELDENAYIEADLEMSDSPNISEAVEEESLQLEEEENFMQMFY